MSDKLVELIVLLAFVGTFAWLYGWQKGFKDGREYAAFNPKEK